MAFERKGLARNSSGVGDNPTIWTYRTLDAVATVIAASYFNDAASEMKRGDGLHIWDDNLGDYLISFVKTNNGVNVVVASGTAVGDV